MSERPVVLITGAARRVGAAIARALAAAGHDIALHCRHSQAEAQALATDLRALGARVEICVADLADEVQTNNLVPQAVAQMGRLDALVNNASVFAYDSVADFSRTALAHHAAVNTAAPIELARALHQHLVDAGRLGCVVNLLDQKLWNPNPDYLSYTLSKAALESANTLLAQALAPVLRVCGVAPGVTLVSGPDMTAEGFAQAHRMTPLGRSSSPEDIAHAVRFLIESPAITGTTLLVDGGQHLSAQPRDVLFLTEKR